MDFRYRHSFGPLILITSLFLTDGKWLTQCLTRIAWSVTCSNYECDYHYLLF